MVEHVSSLTRCGLCLTATDHTTSKFMLQWMNIVTQWRHFLSVSLVDIDCLMMDHRADGLTILLLNTRLHHSFVLILKSITSYVLLRTEICIINRVIRQYISKSCHLIVDQSIFHQSTMIIIQEFSSAANFFYSKCRLFMFSWIWGYVYNATSYFTTIFPFSSAFK